MVLDEQVQQRLAGYIQGVIELYFEELETERKSTRRGKDADESDTGMDTDGPVKQKRKGKRLNSRAAGKHPSGQ